MVLAVPSVRFGKGRAVESHAYGTILVVSHTHAVIKAGHASRWGENTAKSCSVVVVVVVVALVLHTSVNSPNKELAPGPPGCHHRGVSMSGWWFSKGQQVKHSGSGSEPCSQMTSGASWSPDWAGKNQKKRFELVEALTVRKAEKEGWLKSFKVT